MEDSSELKKIKKEYTKRRKIKKEFLLLGYPHSCHYDINVPQIIPNTYYVIEIQVMKVLFKLGYDVTYNIHPDRLSENICIFKNILKYQLHGMKRLKKILIIPCSLIIGLQL